jgi:hypothetical protein
MEGSFGQFKISKQSEVVVTTLNRVLSLLVRASEKQFSGFGSSEKIPGDGDGDRRNTQRGKKFSCSLSMQSSANIPLSVLLLLVPGGGCALGVGFDGAFDRITGIGPRSEIVRLDEAEEKALYRI